MSAALSAEQRTSLEKLIQNARRLIEEDLHKTLEGRFGINGDGQIEPEGSLSLSNAQAAARADLVEIVEFLRSEGESEDGSIARLVREAAFTHTNRLIAVRVAEAIGLLPETMARGVASTGFHDFSELAPTVGNTEWARFAEFIRLCADELAADVPALFDPRNPLIELGMSESVLAKIVETIAALDASLWEAPDTLGWAYQFFNTDKDRRKARYLKDGSPKPPHSSEDLAVRNQFFTPSYVVEFLVQNGLGAHLAAAHPGLANELPLLVEVPTEKIEIDLDNINVLDPACGSGHFLLGAYDVLEKAWEHAGVQARDAAPAIVRSLWGIDIDPRATQIAQTAVMFRARRHCPNDKLPPANVICARSLPTGPEVDILIAALPEHVGRAVKGIADELVDAPILGSLLKVEERLSREVRDVFGTGVVAGTLSEGVEPDAENIEAAVLVALSAIADSTTSTATQRLFAAEAHDAVRFVEAMARRYTAILMNPPFGEPVPSTKSYLMAAYPWIPNKDYNLLAAFVGRGLELAEARVGTCGAITSRGGLITKTFEDWRKDILLKHRLSVLADLGERVMEQARVEAAAYVLARDEPRGSAVFLRVNSESDRGGALVEAARAYRQGRPDDRVYVVELSEFAAIHGSPIAYWMSSSVRDQFRSTTAFENANVQVKVGLQTGDDFRFVRAFWEVDPGRVGYSSAEAKRGRCWVPFAKGGEYSPYWGDIHLLVDWTDGGDHLKSFSGSVIRNRKFYFRRGLTWPRRTVKGFNPRVLPGGATFADKGSCVFIEGDDEQSLLCALGYLLSRAGQVFLGYLATFGSWEVGAVKRLPSVPSFDDPSRVAEAVRSIVRWKTRLDEADETTGRFVAPASNLDVRPVPFNDLAYVDKAVLDALGFDEADRHGLDEEFGVLPTSYGDDDRFGRSPTVFWLDESLETKAHQERRSPVGSTPDPVAGDKSFAELVSHAVGCAFGRWDIEIGRDPKMAPRPADIWEPRPSLPPGALLRQRDGYPFEVAYHGVMTDQSGAESDIARRVVSALTFVTGKTEDDLATFLTGASMPVAGFLRKKFFPYHLDQYSRSNRKAPIYWQLQVPSKIWGVWLYAPKLSREMLFAVVRETEKRQRLAEQLIGHLRREAQAGTEGRKASDVAKDLESEQRLAVELKTFRAEAERIANLRWDPDLDDGMVLNAAPLADLFPAWKDAARYRKELRAGKYKWATVAQYSDRL